MAGIVSQGVVGILPRWRRPDLPRPFRVPLFPLLPMLFCGSCLFVLWSSLANVRLGGLVLLWVWRASRGDLPPRR